MNNRKRKNDRPVQINIFRVTLVSLCSALLCSARCRVLLSDFHVRGLDLQATTKTPSEHERTYNKTLSEKHVTIRYTCPETSTTLRTPTVGESRPLSSPRRRRRRRGMHMYIGTRKWIRTHQRYTLCSRTSGGEVHI